MMGRLLSTFWMVVFIFCYMGAVFGILLFIATVISGNLYLLVASISVLYISALTGREAADRMW